MRMLELIDLAKKTSGISLGQMATELEVHQNRISEWKAGKRKPDAAEIAYFAEKAGLDVAMTLMEVQKTLEPRFSEMWERALGNLRAAAAAAAAAGMTPGHSIYSTTKTAVDVFKS